MPLVPTPTASPAPVLTPYEEAEIRLQQAIEAQRQELQRRAQAQQQQQSPVGSIGTIVAGNRALDSVLGGGASSPATPVVLGSPSTSGLAETEAANAAFNHGADAATAAEQGFFTTPRDSLGGATAGQALAAAAALKGGYDSIKAWQNGGEGLRGSMATTGGGIGYLVGGPVGGAIGAVAGNALGYGAKRLGLTHKTTRQLEAERWGGLSDSGIDQSTLGTLAAANHPAGDTGENWTPEYEAQAMKDPMQMWGSYGMLQTFGGDYFNKMSEFQRYAATKAAIDNGLLDADRGDIIVTDPEKLKSLVPSYYADEKVQQEYNAAKANAAGVAPQGGGAESLDSALNASLSSMATQAKESARYGKIMNYVQSAAKPIDIPKIGGGAVHTGVENLDNILGGVLQ